MRFLSTGRLLDDLDATVRPVIGSFPLFAVAVPERVRVLLVELESNHKQLEREIITLQTAS